MGNSAGTYVFALAGKADADNIIPVIWETSRDGQRCDVVITDREVFAAQSTAWWVRERPSVRIIARLANGGAPSFVERLRRLVWNRAALRRFLRSRDTRLVAVQWREGIAHDSASFLRRGIRWWSTDFFVQLQLAAADLGIPTVALPHGHSTKTTVIRSSHVQAMSSEHDDKLPFADRDSFAAYVFCSDYHRDAILQSSTMSGGNVRVWGSPRFNDAWVPELYAQSPSADLPSRPMSAMRRVLFFLPKWQNLIDRSATMQLISALGGDERIQTVVRGHLRAEATTLEPAERDVLERGNLVIVTDDVPSPSLIAACDVVVDVDSSIAFDAVLLGKPYVRPKYLQDASVTTIWDQLGGAHQTDSLDETIALLTADTLAPAPRDRAFDDVVFGGSGATVLARYRDGLREIALQRRV